MPPSYEVGFGRELLILDSGPIRELVLFHAVEQYGFEGLRRELRFITRGNAYNQCGNFIGSFRRKTTSAAAVVELHNWIRNTERTGQEKLWNRVYDEFREMRMDEEVVNLLEMEIELVARFGPMDMSLIELAKKHNHLHPLILTIDGKLEAECIRTCLKVQTLLDLVPGE